MRKRCSAGLVCHQGAACPRSGTGWSGYGDHGCQGGRRWMLKMKDRLVEGHAWWELGRWRWIGTGVDRGKQEHRPRKVNKSELRRRLCGAWKAEHASQDRQQESVKWMNGMKEKVVAAVRLRRKCCWNAGRPCLSLSGQQLRHGANIALELHSSSMFARIPSLCYPLCSPR